MCILMDVLILCLPLMWREHIKGEVQETITVYEDGGYTRLSDEKEQIEAHADLSQYTEEEMENC